MKLNMVKKNISLEEIEKYGQILNLRDVFYSNLHEVNWMKLNLYRYEPGSIIVYKNDLFEIKKVLHHQESFHFVSSKLVNLGIDEFSRSVKIKAEIPSMVEIVKFCDMIHYKSYSEKCIENNRYVIVDNCDVLNILTKNSE